MAGRSLFERLRSAGRETTRVVRDDEQTLRRSIAANLENLFNAWAGNAPAQMDLGLPTPAEIAYRYPDSIQDVRRALQTTIEKYEPRLSDVRVIHVESEEDRLQVRFQVEAVLEIEGRRERIAFDTLVDHSGEVRLLTG